MEAKNELLQIHSMIMCTAQVTPETPADGYTANSVKQLILFYNSLRPTVEYVEELENRYSELLIVNSKYAAIKAELEEQGVHLLSKDCWCEPTVETP